MTKTSNAERLPQGGFFNSYGHINVFFKLGHYCIYKVNTLMNQFIVSGRCLQFFPRSSIAVFQVFFSIKVVCWRLPDLNKAELQILLY